MLVHLDSLPTPQVGRHFRRKRTVAAEGADTGSSPVEGASITAGQAPFRRGLRAVVPDTCQIRTSLGSTMWTATHLTRPHRHSRDGARRRLSIAASAGFNDPTDLSLVRYWYGRQRARGNLETLRLADRAERPGRWGGPGPGPGPVDRLAQGHPGRLSDHIRPLGGRERPGTHRVAAAGARRDQHRRRPAARRRRRAGAPAGERWNPAPVGAPVPRQGPLLAAARAVDDHVRGPGHRGPAQRRERT